MTKTVSTQNEILEGLLNAKGFKFALVVSRFNDFISQRLLEGAIDCLERHGDGEVSYNIIKVPGAFDLPATINKVVDTDTYDAVVCLGAVIRGSTPHFDYVASEVAKGIAQVALRGKMPVTFGVLTTDNIEQAMERAGSKFGNKGWDATLAAIELVNLWSEL